MINDLSVYTNDPADVLSSTINIRNMPGDEKLLLILLNLPTVYRRINACNNRVPKKPRR